MSSFISYLEWVTTIVMNYAEGLGSQNVELI